MKRNLLATGIFVVTAIVIFSAGIFFIGDKHKAFNRHVDYYANLLNVEGLAPGAKVRVSGYDGGQVAKIEIPDKPSARFRLALHIDDKLKGLIRTDSVVSVESDGLVGDKFVLVHAGSDNAQEASAGSTLPTKEPIELSAVVEKMTGIMDKANATIGDVNQKVDVALDSLTGTINNANGLVSSVRNGNGTVGMLLTNEQTSQDVKTAIVNTRQATDNLNQLTVQGRQMISDIQARNLGQKAEDAMNNANAATGSLKDASSQLDAGVREALAPDASGVNAAQNLRDTLSNVDQATQNLSDDTEALKHGFLFRGFFKKRGFYNLNELSPEEYRTQTLFTSSVDQRVWLNASSDFQSDGKGKETLTRTGADELNNLVAQSKESIGGKTIVIEGYASQAAPADQLVLSRTRALMVKRYFENHYQLSATNIGVVALNSTPPPSTGKSSWDGVCLVLLNRKK